MNLPIKLNIVARSMSIEDFSELVVAGINDPGGERPLDVIRRLYRLGRNTFIIRSKIAGGPDENQLCVIGYCGPEWTIVSDKYGSYEQITLEQAVDIFERGYHLSLFS